MIGFVEGKNQNQNRIVFCSESEWQMLAILLMVIENNQIKKLVGTRIAKLNPRTDQ